MRSEIGTFPPRDARRRGNAMTELVICLLPYAFLVLGVILLGHLAEGKQEIMEAVAWAAPKRGNQAGASTDFFFRPTRLSPLMEGEAELGEEPAGLDASAEREEEPVLPYDTQNMRDAYELVTWDPRRQIEVSGPDDAGMDDRDRMTETGRYLDTHGIRDLDGETALALNGHLEYSLAWARYAFQLRTGERLPFETDDPGGGRDYRQAFRDAFTLGGPEAEGFRLQSASPDPSSDAWRGKHYDDPQGNRDPIRWDGLPELGVDYPDGMETEHLPGMENYWQKDYGIEE